MSFLRWLPTLARRDHLWRRVALVCAALWALLALVQVDHKATLGQQALLKWGPDFAAVERGESPYTPLDPRTAQEGFPGTPTALVLLAPWTKLGERLGCLCFALVKLGCAALLLLGALQLAFGHWRRTPGALVCALLLLSGRVLHSDLLHGNTNLLVAGGIAASMLAFARGREATSGAWIAFATALKFTPALFLLYFAWKRSARALQGCAAGLLLLCGLLPALAFGPARALELWQGWGAQMLAPYLTGAPPTLVQSEHINQSLYGLLARLSTGAVAIAAAPPRHPQDVHLALVELSAEHFRLLHLALCMGLLALVLSATRPREHAPSQLLGEFALWSLALSLLSERSWKQHYVLLALPLAYLLAHVWQRGPRARVALLAVVASLALHALSGAAVLGERASDYAEAYGAWTLGALALMVGCWLVNRQRGIAPHTQDLALLH